MNLKKSFLVHLFFDLVEQFQPRPSVMLLARLMEFKLRRNEHKGGNWPTHAYGKDGKRDWQNLTIGYLLTRLEDESEELREEYEFCGQEPSIDLLFECADVANFSMMIADNTRMNLLAEEKAEEEAEEDLDERDTNP